MELIPRNKMEETALEMLKEAESQGKSLHGIARDTIIDMMLRQMDEQEA